MIVLDRPQWVADWVAAQSGNSAPTVDAAIGYRDEDGLKAGVYFENFTANNIFVHTACARAAGMPVSLLRAVALYVFGQLNLERMTFPISAGNAAARESIRQVGATLEVKLRRACGEHDLELWVLWASDRVPSRLLKRATMEEAACG